MGYHTFVEGKIFVEFPDSDKDMSEDIESLWETVSDTAMGGVLEMSICWSGPNKNPDGCNLTPNIYVSNIDQIVKALKLIHNEFIIPLYKKYQPEYINDETKLNEIDHYMSGMIMFSEDTPGDNDRFGILRVSNNECVILYQSVDGDMMTNKACKKKIRFAE